MQRRQRPSGEKLVGQGDRRDLPAQASPQRLGCHSFEQPSDNRVVFQRHRQPVRIDFGQHRVGVERLQVGVWTTATSTLYADSSSAANRARIVIDPLDTKTITDRLAGTPVQVVMDFSHIVASGGDPSQFVDSFAGRIAHVHIRDAAPGNINLSVGRGGVDFTHGLKALADAAFPGHFALELETREITDAERPAATASAAQLISDLI